MPSADYVYSYISSFMCKEILGIFWSQLALVSNCFFDSGDLFIVKFLYMTFG